MGSNLDRLVASLRETAEIKRDLRNDEDIIAWVRSNWHLFVPRRRLMTDAVAQMQEGTFTYDVPGLELALELPEDLFLRRLKAEEAKKTMWQWHGSKAEEVFLGISREYPSPTVLFVAGQSSIVATTAYVSGAPGLQISKVSRTAEDGGDVHIYKAEQATIRQPRIFRGKQ